MKIKHSLLYLGIILSLSACAATPERTVVLPYHFTITGFKDTRLEKNKLMLVEPFSKMKFIKAMRQALPYPMFGAVPATLSFTLVDYNATKHEQDFAMSMALDYEVKTDQALLAKGQQVCSQVWNSQYGLPDITQGLPKRQQFTKAGMHAKIWGDMRAACAEKVATGITEALIEQEGAPL